MKKICLMLTTILLLTVFCSCGGSQIQYVKEFSYLPAYPGMTLSSENSKADANGFKGALYVVKDSKSSDVLDKYEKLLNNNGWKTTKNSKPLYIVMDKASHRAVITATQNGNNANFTIVTK